MSVIESNHIACRNDRQQANRITIAARRNREQNPTRLTFGDVIQDLYSPVGGL